MTGGREPLSRPSSRHGEARHPLTLYLLMLRVARAASEIAKAGDRTLKRGGGRYLTRAGGKAGLVDFPSLHMKP
jgi:hypothetical protein